MKKSTKTFVLSDETPNLYDFTTDTEGIDLTDYLENPVMLFGHDYSKVIGQWTDLRKEGGKLLGVPMFDEEDPEAMKYYSKVEQGILKGASIGITPMQFDEATKRMVKSSLKETSLTPVPANRKAIAIALYDNSGKTLSADQAKEYLLSMQQTTPSANKKQNMKQSLITALVALCVQAGHTITLSDKSTEDDFEAGLKVVGSKMTELSGKIKTMEDTAKDEAEKEHKALIKKAVDDKLLTAENVPAFESLSLTNLKVVLSTMKPVTLSTIQEEKEKTTNPNDAHAKWTYDEFALNAPKELEKMQTAEPERFQKLLSAKLESSRQNHSIEV